MVATGAPCLARTNRMCRRPRRPSRSCCSRCRQTWCVRLDAQRRTRPAGIHACAPLAAAAAGRTRTTRGAQRALPRSHRPRWPPGARPRAPADARGVHHARPAAGSAVARDGARRLGAQRSRTANGRNARVSACAAVAPQLRTSMCARHTSLVALRLALRAQFCQLTFCQEFTTRPRASGRRCRTPQAWPRSCASCASGASSRQSCGFRRRVCLRYAAMLLACPCSTRAG